MPDNQQRAAVAKLATYCENMIARGKLPMLDEMNLRNFVNETCAAFDMPLVQDRLEQDLQAIRQCMERT
jgi:hypothetical protein